VATRNIEANSIAGGIPAKQLKTKDQARQFEDRETYKKPPSTGEHCE